MTICWKNINIVITGGGGLLGTGMAIEFAKLGANLIIADINYNAAQATAQIAAEYGINAYAFECDVSNINSMNDLVEFSYSKLGIINILCNNSGKAILKQYHELSIEDWHNSLNANLHGVINGIHAFLPKFRQQIGFKYIVNTSSMSGVGLASMRTINTPYVTSKFAVVGLSEALSAALSQDDIGVSVLCPGMTIKDKNQPMTYKTPSAEFYKNNLKDAKDCALALIKGIENNCLHIFSNEDGIIEIEERQKLLIESYNKLWDNL